MIQHYIIIHFVIMMLIKKIVNGIVLNVKNVFLGDNGIVEYVINVCIEHKMKFLV
jgi:hypothetical protein